MIISISGKIGSGKDTVGQIIQYLTEPINEGTTLAEWYAHEWKAKRSDWQIKKFADSLKDIVCILTGCTREKLEDSNFKNSKLSDEWIRYGYADGFIRKYIGDGDMGDPIMNNTQCSKEKYEEERRINWPTAYKVHYSYRDLLQYLGTELLRKQLHEDVWVNALFSEYKSKTYTGFDPNAPIQGVPTEDDEVRYGKIITEYPNWIITDMRFPNELKAVKDKGGITIRCNRGLKDISGNNRHAELNITNQHPSETALDGATFDHILDNNGTIEELIVQVKEILIKEKIL